MGFNYKEGKICLLLVFLIATIYLLAVPHYVSAQEDKNNQIELNKESKSWLGGILDFFKSLFNAIFQIDAKELKNATENQSIINKSEETNNTEAGITEESEEIINISSTTCGYCQYLINDTCLNYSCCKDEECKANEICFGHECVNLSCEACQYTENHECVDYECCKDEDCENGKVCIDHTCIIKNNEILYQTIPFETLQLESDSYMARYNGSLMVSDVSIGFSLITNKELWKDVYDNISGISRPEFSDFDNYFLLFAYMGPECARIYPEIENITQKENKIYVTARRMGQCKDVGDEGWHIVKIKRSDLVLRDNLTFVFIANVYAGAGYKERGSINIKQI